MGHVRRMCALAALSLTIVSTLDAQTYPTGKDARNGLKSGVLDAGVASEGMKLVSFTPKSAEFDSTRGLTFVNSDLAFRGNYVYQGQLCRLLHLGREQPGQAGQGGGGVVHYVAG